LCTQSPDPTTHTLLAIFFTNPFRLTHYHAPGTDLKNYRGPFIIPRTRHLNSGGIQRLNDDQKTSHRFVNKPFDKYTCSTWARLPIEKAKKLNYRCTAEVRGSSRMLPKPTAAPVCRYDADIPGNQRSGSAIWNTKRPVWILTTMMHQKTKIWSKIISRK
jgi:hypothetical protein